MIREEIAEKVIEIHISQQDRLMFPPIHLIVYKLALAVIFSHILAEIRLKITKLTVLTVDVKF